MSEPIVNDDLDYQNEMVKVRKYLSDQKPPTPLRTPNRHRKIVDPNSIALNKH